jgi:hypothetical protein
VTRVRGVRPAVAIGIAAVGIAVADPAEAAPRIPAALLGALCTAGDELGCFERHAGRCLGDVAAEACYQLALLHDAGRAVDAGWAELLHAMACHGGHPDACRREAELARSRP